MNIWKSPAETVDYVYSWSIRALARKGSSYKISHTCTYPNESSNISRLEAISGQSKLSVILDQSSV